jgi:hypothetical protein
MLSPMIKVSKEWLAERTRENPLTFAREYDRKFAAGYDTWFPDELFGSDGAA